MAVQPWNSGARAWGPGQPVPPPYAAMRAAHTDRERIVDVLKAAYAEGRLSYEEYGHRVGAAHRALTYGELAALVADVPSGPMVLPVGMPLPAYAPPARRTDPLAVAALVLGLAGFVTFGTTALPAVVCGYLARARARERNESGDGMATAGLVLGWLGTAGWVLLSVGMGLTHILVS